MHKTIYLIIFLILSLGTSTLIFGQNQRQFFLDTWKEKIYTTPSSYTNQQLSSTASEGTVSFNVNTIINKVLPTHLGVNTTFRNGNTQLDRTQLYTNAGIGSMRYPAGSGSNIYFYDGNTPTETRVEFNPIDGTLSKHNSMPPEMFVQFKKNANSEATVVVNYFYARYGITAEGTREARVQQAADYAAGFVRRLNIELGADVKYWEIGNECYGAWEEGFEIDGVVTTGQEYGEDFCVFAEAMKAVDASIKVGAVVTREDDDWNSGLLPEVKDHADFLVVHNYFTTVKNATAENILASVPQVESVHTTLLDCIEKYTGKARDYYPVAMTEFNSRGPMNCTMVNGLFVTQVLAEAIKNGYGMVDLWVSEWNWSEAAQESKGFLAKADPQQADFSPRQSYMPFQYIHSHFGDQMIEASSNNTHIKTYASTFSSGEVGLIIINTDANAHTVNIDLSTFATEEADMYWHELHANNLEAGDHKFYINGETGTTTGGGPDNFANIAPFKAHLKSGKSFEAKKYSVNFIVLKPKVIKPRRNVLMIAVDDLRPVLNCYGESQIHSPNIDRLAEQGVVFTKAYCQWAVCGPSRASIMSGLTPDGTGIRNLSSQLRTENPDVVTLPEYFLTNNYTTAGAGKVYDPRNVDDNHDIYSWSIPYTNPSDYTYPAEYGDFVQGSNYRVSANTSTEQGPDGVEDDGYTDGQIALDALGKLDALAADSENFFLAVGFKKPHIPFVAPKKYWELYDRASLDLAEFQKMATGSPDYAYHTPEPMSYNDIPNEWTLNDPTLGDGILTLDDQRKLLHGYYACVSYIDAQVGKLLDKLEEKSLADNTVILLFGDHGYHLGDHNQWGKHTQFENSVRAPLIISSPDGITGTNNTPVEFTDIYPTLCDLAGLDVPQNTLQGESLSPALRGEELSKNMAVSEYRKGGGASYSFRTDRYRLTLWMHSSDDRTDLMDWDESRIKEIELYDYDADPLETINLANDVSYSSLISDLKTKAAAWWTQQHNFFNGSTTGELGIPYIEHFENYNLTDAFQGDYWLHNASIWERLWKTDFVNSFSAEVIDDSANDGSKALEITLNPKSSAEGGSLIKLRTIEMTQFEGHDYIVSFKARTNEAGNDLLAVGAHSSASKQHKLTGNYEQYFDTVLLTNNRLFIYFNNMNIPANTEYKIWIDDIKISRATPTVTDDIHNTETKSITIFPIPAEDILHFKGIDRVDSSSIYNSNGQLVLKNSKEHQSVNISTLVKGVYYIEIISKGKKSVHKFIKS